MKRLEKFHLNLPINPNRGVVDDGRELYILFDKVLMTKILICDGYT